MKFLQFFLFLCCCTICLTTVAQKKNALTDHTNVIKINFNSDIQYGGIPLAWEIRTNKRQSLQIAATVTYNKDDFSKVSGIGFSPEYRFYLSKNKPGISGVYAGPFASVNFLTFVDNDYYNGTSTVIAKYHNTVYSGGIIFGHQWAWQSGFALDLNLGLGVRGVNSTRTANTNFRSDVAEGFLPRLGLAIGYAF